jgi:hypothetical protein
MTTCGVEVAVEEKGVVNGSVTTARQREQQEGEEGLDFFHRRTWVLLHDSSVPYEVTQSE